MRKLLLSLGLFASIVTALAQPVRLQPWTTNAADVVTNVVKSLATNVVTQNASGGSQTPWAGDIAAGFHSLTGAATLVSSNSITTNSANFGSNGVAPAGIVLDAEGAARVNGTLSVSNAVLIQGSSLTLPTGSITIPAGTVTANLFSGNGGSLTAIPESSVSGLITDLAAKFGTLVATTTGLATSGNGTSTATLSSPGFVWTNGLSVAAVASNSFTIRDSTGASVVISNGVIGTVNGITNIGNIQTATLNATTSISVGGTGPSIYNGGITNHGVLDQFGRQTNYDVVIGTAQTNSGNIQAATMNTTGNAVVGGTLSVGGSGSIQAANSNFFNLAVVKALAYPTNISIMSPDFTKGIATIKTNAAFKILQPVGIDAAKLTYQYAIQIFTNSTAAALAITPSDNCHAVGVQFVTNVTQVLTEYDSSLNITNQYFVTIF